VFLTLSYLPTLRDSVTGEKELPSTPPKQSSTEEQENKSLSPSQIRLEALGSISLILVFIDSSERKHAALIGQHSNLSHDVSNLENLLTPNLATNDPFARMELERKLDEVKRQRSRVEKEKMEVGILITRLRRKLDDQEGRGDSDSFIWSRKWTATKE
jgi:hypothetical protein